MLWGGVMARIRTVKPEFWTSEQVAECSTTTRLLFIGMWNFCDDGGNHPASLKQLKMQIFPSDDISVAEIGVMVNELITNELIDKYEANGKQYWHVLGWHHQKIDKPNYKHPKYSTTTSQPFDDHSTTTSQPFTPVRESKGMEGNGMELNKHTKSASEEKNEQSIIDELTKDTRVNFLMHFDWQPNQQEFEGYCVNTYSFDPKKLTPDILKDFIGKAKANGEKHTETKWCKFLAAFTKKWISNPEFPTKQNPHIYQPEQQAASSGYKPPENVFVDDTPRQPKEVRERMAKQLRESMQGVIQNVSI